jgi:hypothetical protein
MNNYRPPSSQYTHSGSIGNANQGMYYGYGGNQPNQNAGFNTGITIPMQPSGSGTSTMIPSPQVNAYGANTKEQQMQELKIKFNDFVYKPHNNASPSYEIIEFTLTLDNGSLKIPLALLLDTSFPQSSPRIFVRTRLHHKFIEVGSLGSEIQVSQIMMWNNKCTLLQLVNNLKIALEKDPPKQDKIVDEVNGMLSKISPDDFKELVSADWLNNIQAQQLKQYAASPNFEEVIVTSKNYKKIAQNIVDCASFNEKLANELLAKKEQLEADRKQFGSVSRKIEQLRHDVSLKQERVKKYADRFNRPSMERCLVDEIRKLDDLSSELDQGGSTFLGRQTPSGNNFEDTLSLYFETRKKYHQLTIIREKLNS